MHVTATLHPKDTSALRRVIGLEDDELFILQPTRVVARKGIEHAIELIRRLRMKATLIISHAAGDEGLAYERRVQEFVEFLGVRLKIVSKLLGESRGTKTSGLNTYALADIYPLADLVTYPSIFEGFGNAFMAAHNYELALRYYSYTVLRQKLKALLMECFGE
jgi:glycosyltransferase involved in cell wall biosynthesis